MSEFYGQQHLQNQTINNLNFSYSGSYQAKITSQAITVGWVCPGMPSHVQNCLNMSEEGDWLLLAWKNYIKDN